MPSSDELSRRATDAAELAARDSYGRLLARLVVRTREVEQAEDALSDAFLAALRQWPTEGVPENPDGWLLHVAKRRLSDTARHRATRAALEPMLVIEEEHQRESRHSRATDDRLEMLFLCAHPEIEPAARAPLMLQLVLGLDAARIASAFLTSPATMSQRLVRAKQRIREAGLTLEPPVPEEREARLQEVLDAIYAAYGAGWDAAPGAESSVGGLRGEALWLARLVCAASPSSAEAHGLLALLSYCESRQRARRDAAGRYVPLDAQDPQSWDGTLVREAERMLAAAAERLSTTLPGRFQLEAAIQSVHARRAESGTTDWETIVQFYLGLMQVAPSVGAAVAHGAALAHAYGPRAGLDALRAIPGELVQSYQPYWVVYAHLLKRIDAPDADSVKQRAIGLTTDPAVRTFLQTAP